ncbi:Hypp8284 [Branchiostoma lanceolatum]|uniref:Hypp8284 protein n=1 Tax=Branchiostoma lanceolatum TaxID=7740 RepID=A0A8J9Z6G7_BRALA|nr:Hypp8284 [Branchiostoma lanceolatum]
MSHLILTTSCRTDLNHSVSRKIEHGMKERPRCPPALLGRGNGLAAVPIAVWDGVDVETEAWRMEEGQLEIKCRRGNCQNPEAIGSLPAEYTNGGWGKRGERGDESYHSVPSADREDKNFKMDRLQAEIQKDREFITQQAAKQKGKLEHEAIYSHFEEKSWWDTVEEAGYEEVQDGRIEEILDRDASKGRDGNGGRYYSSRETEVPQAATERILQELENNKGTQAAKGPTVLQAVRFVGTAWRDTSAETILKCFQKAGFSKSPRDERTVRQNLVSDLPSEGCKHGHDLDPRDPVAQQWTQQVGVCIYTRYLNITYYPAPSGQRLPRVIYYGPTVGECACRHQYDGAADLLHNIDNSPAATEDLPVVTGSRHSERVFIDCAKSHRLLLRYSGYKDQPSRLVEFGQQRVGHYSCTCPADMRMNVIDELASRETKRVANIINKVKDHLLNGKNIVQASGLRYAVLVLLHELKEDGTARSKSIFLIETLAITQQLCYADADDRSITTVFRMNNAMFLYHLMMKACFPGTPNTISVRRLMGHHLHSLRDHIPITYRVVAIRSTLAENEERQFSTLKRITKSSANYSKPAKEQREVVIPDPSQRAKKVVRPP